MSQPTPNQCLGACASFPRFSPGNHSITSPRDPCYNCIAWAAGDQSAWWEPDANNQWYWPTGVAREYTLAAYVAAYATLGYKPCGDNDRLENRWEKVAIYVNSSGMPTHAARQLDSGRWTSKLGKSYDIEHLRDSVGGGMYGDVQVILRRPRVRSYQGGIAIFCWAGFLSLWSLMKKLWVHLLGCACHLAGSSARWFPLARRVLYGGWISLKSPAC